MASKCHLGKQCCDVQEVLSENKAIRDASSMFGFIDWHVGFCPRDVLAAIGCLYLWTFCLCVLVVWQRDLGTSSIIDKQSASHRL